MGKFTGLNDQERAVVEPLISYRWGITQSGTQPLHLSEKNPQYTGLDIDDRGSLVRCACR